MEKTEGPKKQGRSHELRRVTVKKKGASKTGARRRRLWRAAPDFLIALGLVLSILLLINPFPAFAGNDTSLGARLIQIMAYEHGALVTGLALLVLMLIAGSYRLHWRVRQNKRWWVGHGCPRCGHEELRRTPRKWYHRLPDDLDVPLRNYICPSCHWSGGRIDETRL